MDQPLEDVVFSQVRAPHAAGVVPVRECPLNQLGALPQQPLAPRPLQASPIRRDQSLLIFLAYPAASRPASSRGYRFAPPRPASVGAWGRCDTPYPPPPLRSYPDPLAGFSSGWASASRSISSAIAVPASARVSFSVVVSPDALPARSLPPPLRCPGPRPARPCARSSSVRSTH